MRKASSNHVERNRHHPEFHDETIMLSSRNNDKIDRQIVNETMMKFEDITEMVVDWCGMSEELGEDPHDRAQNNINIRWKFTDE